MAKRLHIIEQAFVLAKSGRFTSVEDIERALIADQYEDAFMHLRPAGLRRELRAAMPKAK